MKIIITGSREYTNVVKMYHAICDALQEIYDINDVVELTIVHGNAPGADTCAEKLCELMKNSTAVNPILANTIPYNADWTKYKKFAGPIRNAKMVEEHKDAYVGIAFWDGSIENSGTWDCIKQFKKHNIRTHIVWVTPEDIITNADRV